MKSICINLPRRSDRLRKVNHELNRAGFEDVEFFPATENPNGMRGLHVTMIRLFQLYAGQEIIVFEDDVKFSKDKFYMDTIVERYLPKDYYLFYLGGNATQIMHGPKYYPIRQTKGGYLTSHAIMYSAQATQDMANFLELPKEVTRENTYDVFLSNTIQPHFKCFAAWPAIAHQENGYSDISKLHINYDYFHNKTKNFYL